MMATPTETDLMDLIPPEAEIVRRIVQEVRRYPRIRQPLLRFLTADDFDELLAAVRENSDNIKLILERMGVIEQAVERIPAMEERLTSVEKAVQRIPVIEERLTSVEIAVQRIPVIEERLTSVEEAVAHIPAIESELRRVSGSLGELRGGGYENECAAEIDGILDGYMEFAVLADRAKIKEPFLDARGKGLISREEFLEGYRPDIIARGRQDTEENEALAVVEVSITFNREDLENAARRAELIGRVTGIPTAAYLVTLYDWPGDMDDTARELGVTIVQHFLPKYSALS